ncbi:MAG: TonB-dependent receptor plug domain-containing protein, partial [Longimicrobiales bacterium]
MSRSRFDPAARAAVRSVTALAVTLVLGFGAGGVAAQNTGSVTGVVRDAVSRAPLSGVRVWIPGTTLDQVANNVGRYLLLNVPAGQHTIEARSIGYGTISRTVTVTAGEATVVDFDLREEAIALEAVVVTGTAGAARRREIGNQISQIKASDIALATVTDLGDILQGRSTGVQINDFGGQVGAASQIRLRGNSSLTQGNSPLIYIDGIRMEVGALSEDDEAGAEASAFDMINPHDIERIEIVKGPAATTLYGTEAAGGVIQIFTKRGAAGTPAWQFSVDQGLSKMPFLESSLNPRSINPTGYQMSDCSRSQVFNSETKQFEIVNEREPGCPDNGSWFRNGHLQRYNLSVRGGSEAVTYFVSGRWAREEGVVDPQGQKSYGVRANVSFQPFNGFNVTMNNNYQQRSVTWIPDGNNASGLTLNVMRGLAGYTPGNDDSKVLDNDLISNIQLFQTGTSLIWTPNNMWAHRLT